MKTGTARRISDENFVAQLPKSYKSKARKILSHINKEQENIRWSNQDELIVDGNMLKNATRHELVRFFIQRKGTLVPAGADEFANLLYRTKVPVTSTGDYFKKKFPKYQRINIAKYMWWKK